MRTIKDSILACALAAAIAILTGAALTGAGQVSVQNDQPLNLCDVAGIVGLANRISPPTDERPPRPTSAGASCEFRRRDHRLIISTARSVPIQGVNIYTFDAPRPSEFGNTDAHSLEAFRVGYAGGRVEGACLPSCMHGADGEREDVLTILSVTWIGDSQELTCCSADDVVGSTHGEQQPGRFEHATEISSALVENSNALNALTGVTARS